MAIDLVLRRIEVHGLVGRVAGDDLVGAHHPHAAALLASGVDVARHLDRHLRVGGVEAAAVLVVEPGLAAHEDLPQRPFLAGGRRALMPACTMRRSRRFFACASAASRTHAPSSAAATRAASRSRLQGPSPAMTRRNSSQSIGPWSCACRASFQLSAGSGSVTPRMRACSTAASMNFWRSSSLLTRLMPQRIDCAELGDWSSGGPNIITDGHHQRIDRVLHHRLLRVGAAGHHRQQRLVALALMEAFLAADADHRPRIRRIGTAADRHLVHDGRAVHQPADRADVGPGQGRIVEDGAVLRLAAVQRIDQLVAGRSQRFCRRIEVEAVAAFVLDLGQQDRLALEARCPADPVAFGKHPDDLRMGMLADLAHQRPAVVFRHPVLGLDEFAGVDARVEALLQSHLVDRSYRLLPFALILACGIHRLRVHPDLLALAIWAACRSPGAPCPSGCARSTPAPSPRPRR